MWYHTFKDDAEDWIATGIIIGCMLLLATRGVFI